MKYLVFIALAVGVALLASSVEGATTSAAATTSGTPAEVTIPDNGAGALSALTPLALLLVAITTLLV